MPRKFKLGDVVEVASLNILGSKGYGLRGVIVRLEYLPKDRYQPSGYWYDVKLFNSPPELMPIEGGFASDFKICEKIRDKCNNCGINEICPHLPDIARCEFSEFGQMRGEGKRDNDVCEQRKCEHRFLCATKRFIQK